MPFIVEIALSILYHVVKGAAVSDCKIIPFPLRDLSTATDEGGCNHEPAPDLASLHSLGDPDRWRRSRLYEVLKQKMLEEGGFVDQEFGRGRETWQPMLSPSKLLIADDHVLFADALSSLVSQRWPSCQIRHIVDANLIAAELEQAGGYDVILLDLRMPGMEGAQSVADIVEAARGAPVILMSGLATGAEISEAFRAGISGFIPKSRTGEDLVSLLSQALMGEKPGAMPDEIITDADEILARLSPRERETALHMARGLSNKEIALFLGISPETVKIYTKSIMTKFSVRNRTEFAIEAMRRGLV